MLGLKLNHVSKRGHRWHHKLILHWLRQTLVAGRYQAITWTKVKLWSLRSGGIHLRAISKNIPQPSIITKMSFKWHRSQWGNVACWHHKTSSILISIGSGNDLAPDKQRVINWTSADLLTFGRLLSRNKCQWILDQVLSLINAFENGAYKWQIFCLGLNESMTWTYMTYGILNIETGRYCGKIPVPQYAFWQWGVASWSPKFVVFLAVVFHNSGDDKYPCKNQHHWSYPMIST